MTDLLQRLRERKLGQWALAYLTGGWVLLQVLGLAAESYGWPRIVMQTSFGIIALGFVVALVLAWYHGERGTQKLSGTELLILTLLLAIGGVLLWRFAHTTHGFGAPGTGTANQAANTDRKSIAVLPFVNMSGDKDNEYFSDGISEEILNVLARTPDLNVAARTSSFSFKGKAMEVPAIAQALNVRMVLEGSVRKQGDRVRITAQLIDAKTGYHVWSQTYDRELKDIFAIQDQIAKAIGDELEVKLAGTPAAGKNSVGTTNLKAYDLYLRGMALWQTRKPDDLWQSIDAFNQAIAADPKFAQAHGGLALSYDVIPDYSNKISNPEAYAKAANAAEMALGLDPTLPEPYVVLASLAGSEGRRETAITLYRRAIALRPSFATAYQWLGTEMLTAGDPAAGIVALDHAAELDPRSLVVADNRAYVLLTLGRNAEARVACERVLSFAPDYLGCQRRIAQAEFLRGDAEAARPFLLRNAELSNPGAVPLVNAVVDALQGRGDRQALARRLAAFPGRSALDPTSGNIFSADEMPALLVMLGAPDLALDYLERRVDDPGQSPVEWPMMLPALDPIRCTPRFKALVQRLKTNDPRAATVCGKGG